MYNNCELFDEQQYFFAALTKGVKLCKRVLCQTLCKQKLKAERKIEDLQYDGLRIIQSADEYRFTTDAVLLANFCGDMHGKLCVEFGAGSGVISILVARKRNLPKSSQSNCSKILPIWLAEA